MSEPGIADVLASIERLSTETRTRHEALASESRSRDMAQTERSVRLEAKMDESVKGLTLGMTTLHGDVATLKSIVPKAEKAAAEAGENARKALDSFHSIEGASQEHWRSVMERIEVQDKQAVELAAKQKAEADAREAAKAEARRQESIAAKRVADERDAKNAAKLEENRLRNERLKIIAPVWQGVAVAVITGVVGYFSVQAAHKDTDA